MSTPVVIQGKPVSAPAAENTAQPISSHANDSNNNASSGDDSNQGGGCKDPFFALLFYANVGIMIWVAAAYGPEAFEGYDDDTVDSYDYSGFVYAVLLTGFISLIMSGVGLALMMTCPQFIIKASLIFVVVMSGVWMVISFISGSIFGGIMGLIFFALSLCYARAVWSRIPFATVNLVTAITAIKANLGCAAFAYGFSLAGMGWSVLWTIGFAGVFEYTYDCNEITGVCTDPNYGYMFLLFVSFFFGHQVLQSSIHVTVAGTVGTWWHSPEENGCCSSGVRNSFVRTVTTSFGSICFGSLLVAIIQALKALAEQARANGDGGIGACIAECILGCLAAMLEYFNKWAFVYVALYGKSYLESGKEVINLFKNRGWEAIIADDLIGNALFLVSLIVGGVMGAIALIFEATTDWFEDFDGSGRAVAFFLGFIVGLAICSILMSTIASAVNAIIVLFADSPREFEANYPELSQKMRQTWNEVYPGSI